MLEKLDSLFTVSSVVEGGETSPDISGLIGQYAHGNDCLLYTSFTKRHIWYYIAFIILYRLGEGFVMKIVPLFLKADTASVSYTPLDVYKRQQENGSQTRFRLVWFLDSYQSF